MLDPERTATVDVSVTAKTNAKHGKQTAYISVSTSDFPQLDPSPVKVTFDILPNNSTTTLRSDTRRTGTNPNFPVNTNPWSKYVSYNLGTTVVGKTTVDRAVRAGVLVIENFLFDEGPHSGAMHTLVLVAPTTNEVYCFSEADLIKHGKAASHLWHTPLGLPPIMRKTSNIAPPIGICGTPVVDTKNRRMFVVAMWDDGTNTGHYSIFNVALDTGKITSHKELTDSGAPGRVTFNADTVDQRTAINLVDGWLWLGFAAFQSDDRGDYYGWVVAINSEDLSRQLYQPMIESTNCYGGGVWGTGGVAASVDGKSVFALTGNANAPDSYWNAITAAGLPVTAAGPGSLRDYFNALVRLKITGSGSSSKIEVSGWFQDSTLRLCRNPIPRRMKASHRSRTAPILTSGDQAPSFFHPSTSSSSSPSYRRTATSSSSNYSTSAASPNHSRDCHSPTRFTRQLKMIPRSQLHSYAHLMAATFSL